MEIQEKQHSLFKGIVGALLGGLLGGASIILLGQMGIVAAISGVILAFCTLKGFELLGGKLNIQGLVVCILVMLVMPYLADRISWAIAIVEQSKDALGVQLSFGDAFQYVHKIVELTESTENYWKDLLFIYAFTILGAFSIVKQAFKQRKVED